MYLISNTDRAQILQFLAMMTAGTPTHRSTAVANRVRMARNLIRKLESKTPWQPKQDGSR